MFLESALISSAECILEGITFELYKKTKLSKAGTVKRTKFTSQLLIPSIMSNLLNLPSLRKYCKQQLKFFTNKGLY